MMKPSRISRLSKFAIMEENNKILIYTDSEGLTKIDVILEDETLWLTQAQMCELYQTSKSNVSEHIKHIFEEGELQEDSVVRKFRTMASVFLIQRPDNGDRCLVLLKSRKVIKAISFLLYAKWLPELSGQAGTLPVLTR